MAYKEDRLNKVIGSLGFSFSSLPFRDGDVDIREVTHAADIFLEARFNYFDISSQYKKAATATIAALQKRYARRSYCLSTAESSLEGYSSRFERLSIEYYDFFALENDAVTDDSIAFLEGEKEKGRIHHLGLKWTGEEDALSGILSSSKGIEYVILPLSASDFFSDTVRRRCYERAVEASVPVIIETGERKEIEESFTEEKKKALHGRHPSWPLIAWNLRFLHSLEGVVTVTMPLGDLSTTKDAIKALRRFSFLKSEEKSLILE